MLRLQVRHYRVLEHTFADYKNLRGVGLSVRKAREVAEELEEFHIATLKKGDDLSVSPRGGTTVVWVVRGATLAGFGIADCSWEDNYCKRTGIKLALKRVIVSGDLCADEWLSLASPYGTDYIGEVFAALCAPR